MERREFLARICSLCAAPWALDALGQELVSQTPLRLATGGNAALSPTELQLVSVIADIVIPETDTPGATAAGVPAFIALLFSDWLLPDEQSAFRSGILELDSTARTKTGRALPECTPAQQLALLEEWDRAATPARTKHEPLPFFGRLKSLILVGYYTSEVGQTQDLKIQFGAGERTPEGPVLVPPPFPV